MWVKGFIYKLGSILITIAEIKAMRWEMEFCLNQLHILMAKIYLDCLDAVNLIYRGGDNDRD